MIEIRIAPKKLIKKVWEEHWGGDFIVTCGVLHTFEDVSGFIAREEEEILGLITYIIDETGCEITSLDSFKESIGVGTKLIEKLVEVAGLKGCRRLWLVTTNDNLKAIGFYQRRGFDLIRVNHNAIVAARRIKPSIPKMGNHNIEIKHELEFEMKL